MLTQALIRELFDYCDGELYWKIPVKGHGGQKMGKIAGTFRQAGPTYTRRVIGIFGYCYSAHRLVFLYHHGFMPEQLDHIDRNPLNNRIENLRTADDSQQEANKSIRSDNKSGFRGVFWNSQKEKWQAKIKHEHLGFFIDPKEAAVAYNVAAREHFGEFAFLNSL